MEREKNILILTSIGGFLQKFEMNVVAILQSYGWKVHYASNFDYPVYKCDIDELKENPGLLGKLFGNLRKQLDKIINSSSNNLSFKRQDYLSPACLSIACSNPFLRAFP